MDKDTLSSLINKKKINIRHEVIDKDHILLLEKPARLQQKLIELEKFPSAYPDRSTLIRIK